MGSGVVDMENRGLGASNWPSLTPAVNYTYTSWNRGKYRAALPLREAPKPRAVGVWSILKEYQLRVWFPTDDRRDLGSRESPFRGRRTYPPELTRKLSYCSQSPSRLRTFSWNASEFWGTNTSAHYASFPASLFPLAFKDPEYR